VTFISGGLFMLLAGQRPRVGAAILVSATVYFAVIKFAVMPRFGTFWYSDIYRQLCPPGEASYGGVVKTLVTNPSSSGRP
jgi:hypothetical protein